MSKHTKVSVANTSFDEQAFDTEQPSIGSQKWLLARLQRLSVLKEATNEYLKIEKELKTVVRDVANKKDVDFERETHKPKPGRTIITINIDNYEIEMDTNRQRKFSVPANIKEKYEVDPSIVKKVSWKRID